MSARITGEIVIERPVEEVFDLVADERNEPRYNRRMLQAEKISPGPVGLGTRFRAEFASRGRPVAVTELTAYDRPRRLASETRMAALAVAGTLTFDELPEGTRMRWDWELAPRGPLALAGPLVALVGRRQERENWESLKRFLEAGSPAAASPEQPDAGSTGRWLLAWLGGPVLGILNGGARDALYEEAVGEQAANVVSTGTLLALLAGYMWLLERRWPLRTRREALTVGAAWAVLTVLFEAGFGRWVEGEPWSAVLEQYDVTAGNAWIVVPAAMAAGPELVRRLAARDAGRRAEPVEAA